MRVRGDPPSNGADHQSFRARDFPVLRLLCGGHLDDLEFLAGNAAPYVCLFDLLRRVVAPPDGDSQLARVAVDDEAETDRLREVASAGRPAFVSGLLGRSCTVRRFIQVVTYLRAGGFGGNRVWRDDESGQVPVGGTDTSRIVRDPLGFQRMAGPRPYEIESQCLDQLVSNLDGTSGRAKGGLGRGYGHRKAVRFLHGTYESPCRCRWGGSRTCRRLPALGTARAGKTKIKRLTKVLLSPDTLHSIATLCPLSIRGQTTSRSVRPRTRPYSRPSRPSPLTTRCRNP